MALRIWTAIAVFLGSYLPLSIILAFQDIAIDQQYGVVSSIYLKHPIISILFILITALGFLLTSIILRHLRPQQTIKIRHIKYIPAEMINYVFPYIVSFMGASYDEIQKLGGLLLFMLTLFVITYRLGKVFVNPMLAVVGWRLYEISYSFPGEENVFEGQALAHGPEPAQTFAQGVLAESLFIFREQARE